jgi:hypothetical protein
MAGRQLGDMKLSAVLTLGSMIAHASLPELQEWLGEDVKNESLEVLVQRCSEGMQSNFGNKLQLDEEDGNIVSGEWLYPEPGKVL